ncbi:MAG: sigma 54-interacting transcriptional regulator [Bryobacteraceae bacterium]
MEASTDSSALTLELLRDGREFILYRGRQRGTPSRILALVAQQAGAVNLRRLEHEYSIADELDAAWAAKPLALIRHEGRTALVLMDPGGDPLDLILERNHGLPLDSMRALRIGIEVASALGQMHRRGLIHKDIKPGNVLVADAGEAHLTGFGIASQLPHESQSPGPPEIIAGTLAYMSPEQTGRMNRSVDSRTDLYSLGVVLYELLTGVLPFTAGDPLEWIHCHIARQPVSPADRAGVLEPLSAIVMKLLAKNAEERYQTAAGVEFDLRKCRAEWHSHGRIDPFVLGAHDFSDRLLIPEKLYGREQEINVLLAAFDRVVERGTSELVLVSGYSGVGKSSVVNELHKALVQPRGSFASGKFDQYKRDIPYATLAQAFQALIRQILAKSEADVAEWRHTLLKALGTNGQLIINLIPELEFVIGEQPATDDLPPQDAKTRFQLVFRRFLGAFAKPERPLALFLDDLQWLDAATLELLEQVILDPELRHLLLIGAYRDNEVSSSHPLTRTLDTIRHAGVAIQELVLRPLDVNDVRRLVADALRCDSRLSSPLADLIHERTAGNPFFAIQFFKGLADDGLLTFEANASAWVWELPRIQTQHYTDNVVDLMVGKLRRLSTRLQTALQQLACLGSAVPHATLALVHGRFAENLHRGLWEAARAGVVLWTEHSYKFLHDRIQEAAYTLIPVNERAEAHLRIGRALLASMTDNDIEEHLFDIANQFKRAAEMIVDPKEKEQLASIHLRAGRKAKASAAYASAREYFTAGIALLDEYSWNNHYRLRFNLSLECAESELLTGNLEQAWKRVTELLRHGASNIDQADVHHLAILLHTVEHNARQAVDTAIAGLRLLGINIPPDATWECVLAEYEALRCNLDGRPIESLTGLPRMADPEMQAAMRLLSAASAPAYYVGFHYFCLVVCRMVNVTLQHGMSAESADAYGRLGLTLGPLFRRYADGYQFAKLACDLVDKHGFSTNRARVYSTTGTVASWTQPITTAISFARTAFHSARESGDLTTACYASSHFISFLLLRNDPLDEVWRESEIALEVTRKAKYYNIVDDIVNQRRYIATMQGRIATFAETPDHAAVNAGPENRGAPSVSHWTFKMQAHFLEGDYRAAFVAGQNAKPLLAGMVGMLKTLDYYYFSALTAAALYEHGAVDEQETWSDLLMMHCEQLREWAEHNPSTFGDKHLLVCAEIARIEGRSSDAMELYEKAIQAAHENGFVQNEATAYEVAARFYLSRGFETFAFTYLRRARDCYERWGAHSKVKHLDEHYPTLHAEQDVNPSVATIGTPAEHLDLATVVRMSQTVSGEIVLKKLIDTLMKTVLQHAGAERGLLILVRDDQWRIEAEAVTGRETITVSLLSEALPTSELPESVIQYVIRTKEEVAIDNAAADRQHAADSYFVRTRARSVLCLPLLKQGKLTGMLYLENRIASHVFTPACTAVLKLLASQAAISLENAYLYADLEETQGYLSEAQRLSLTGSVGWIPSTGELVWSRETYRIFECDPAVKASAELVLERTHPDDRPLVEQMIQRAALTGEDWNIDHRLLMPDGSVKYIHVVAHAIRNDARGDVRFVGAVMDVTAAKRAQEALEQAFREIQTLKHQLQSENIVLREEIDRTSMFEQIVGTSAPLRNVQSRISKVAPTDSTVLITGETGTGKELVARAIHRRSRRATRAFVSVNCAAIPRDLIASELFGHEKGAFTGATQRRLGRFELAEGGTVFLDEVGELPPETQVSLLRVLQEREFERIGSTLTIQTNVRVIAATNRDLEAAIRAGTFRSDLFYRLDVFPIRMPSLQERREDIPLLVEYFIDRFARQAGKSFQAVSKRSLDLLQAYAWPGNIRELQNVIERSVIVCESEEFLGRRELVQAAAFARDADGGIGIVAEVAFGGEGDYRGGTPRKWRAGVRTVRSGY